MERVLRRHLCHLEGCLTLADGDFPPRTPSPAVHKHFIVSACRAIVAHIDGQHCRVSGVGSAYPTAVDNYLIEVVDAELIVLGIADSLIFICAVDSIVVPHSVAARRSVGADVVAGIAALSGPPPSSTKSVCASTHTPLASTASAISILFSCFFLISFFLLTVVFLWIPYSLLLLQEYFLEKLGSIRCDDVNTMEIGRASCRERV